MAQVVDYETPADSPPPAKAALGIIFLIVLIDLMGFGLIIPLLPFYATAYKASPLQVTILFSIYSICQFLAAPLLGIISDRHGRRPVLAFSQVGSAVGYVLLGYTTQHHWDNASTALFLIYASRIIDGITAGNISTAQAYVSDVTTQQNRAKGMGLLGAAFGIGFCLGPGLGGGLGRIHPCLPAYMAGLLSLIAALVTFVKLPESRTRKATEGEVWLHPSRFVRVFTRPALGNLLMISFCIMAAYVMMESTIALFVAEKATFRWGPGRLGLYFLGLGLVIIVVQGGAIHRLTRKYGEWSLSIVGPLVVAVGMAGYVLAGFHPMLWVLILAGVTNSVGRSLHQPTLSALLSKYSSRSEQGVVFGLFHGLGSLARVFGPIIAGLAYTRHITAAFGIAGVIALVVAGWTAAVWIKYPTPANEGADESRGFDVVMEAE